MKLRASRTGHALIGAICLAVVTTAAQRARAATCVVDTASDNAAPSACTASAGDCSLHGAIADVHADGGRYVFTFGSGVFPTPHTITSGSALPLIPDTLIINGSGQSPLTVDDAHSDRPFEVDRGDLTLDSLTIANGSATNGGAICNIGTNGNLTGDPLPGSLADDGGPTQARQTIQPSKRA